MTSGRSKVSVSETDRLDAIVTLTVPPAANALDDPPMAAPPAAGSASGPPVAAPAPPAAGAVADALAAAGAFALFAAGALITLFTSVKILDALVELFPMLSRSTGCGTPAD